MSKRTASAARWREIIDRQARSGLSVAAFCRRSRVAQASFYAWRRKLKETATFAEVRVDPASARDGGFESPVRRHVGALEVVLPGGRGIIVQPGFDRTTLLALVETLERRTVDAGGGESGT